MKLLLHICCAPCSVACVQSLRAEGIEPTGYWYNPNIHPYTEYRARRDTLVEYATNIVLALEMEDFYGLRPFARAVAENISGRCALCYAARLRATARYAAEHGYTHFSTTLLISPYQKHALLCTAAEDAAREFGVTFLYRDFRPLYRQGQEAAKTLGLYMQKYCGCVFSEEERYNSPLRNRLEKSARAKAQAAMPEGAVPLEPTVDFRAAGRRFDAAVAAMEEAPPR
ncbi:MAG: epoxyqueuosine reductase QueH [Eubacteriales bacterium]|nr:epoxyqueuosine reductase QueH [Eubacteriales bacterium]